MSDKTKRIGRIVYVEPNNLADEQYGLKMGNGDNFTWRPEDLSYSVDLQVIVPSRDICGDAEDENVIFNISGPSDGFFSKVGYSSFMEGELRDPNNPDRSFLTDNFTNISYQEFRNNKAGSREALGIQSIDINFDTYFFPKVTMKIIDVRGASLMTPSEEIYREKLNNQKVACEHFFNALFHFPSPRFALSVKGFFGTRVTFMLSVLDFGGSFNSQTGNFEITINFIGHMYGLYSDLPFNFLLIAPYIGGSGGNVNGYWQTQTGVDGNFKYSDGNAIKTYLEFMHIYEGIADNFSSYVSNTNGEAITRVRNIDRKIQNCDRILLAYRNLFDKIGQYTDDSKVITTIDNGISNDNSRNFIVNFEVSSSGKVKLSDCFREYNSIVSEFENDSEFQLTNEFSEWQTAVFFSAINSTPTTRNGVEWKKYTLTASKDQYKRILRKKQSLETQREVETNSDEFRDETISAVGSLLNGFTPTVENTYRMFFAHLDCFMHLYYTLLDEIKNNEKRKSISNYTDIKVGSTDIGVKTAENCFLPPFTGFYNDKRELVYPIDYSSSLSSLEEVKFIDSVFNSLKGLNIRRIRPVVESNSEADVFSGYDENTSPSTIDYIPISVIDFVSNNDNPYKGWAPSENNSFNNLVFIFACRILTAACVEKGLQGENYISLSDSVLNAEVDNVLSQFSAEELRQYSSLTNDLSHKSYSEIYDILTGYTSRENCFKIFCDNHVGGNFPEQFNVSIPHNEKRFIYKNPLRMDSEGTKTLDEYKGLKNPNKDEAYFKDFKKKYDEAHGRSNIAVTDYKSSVRYFYPIQDSFLSLTGPFKKSSFEEKQIASAAYTRIVGRNATPPQEVVDSNGKVNILECSNTAETTNDQYEKLYTESAQFRSSSDYFVPSLSVNVKENNTRKTYNIIKNVDKIITLSTLRYAEVGSEQFFKAAFHFVAAMQNSTYFYGFSDCSRKINHQNGSVSIENISIKSGEVLLLPKSTLLFIGGLARQLKKDDKIRNRVQIIGDKGVYLYDETGAQSVEDEFISWRGERRSGFGYRTPQSHEYCEKVKDVLKNEEKVKYAVEYFENWAKTEFLSLFNSLKDGNNATKRFLNFDSELTNNVGSMFNSILDVFNNDSNNEGLLKLYTDLIVVSNFTGGGRMPPLKMEDIKRFCQKLYEKIQNSSQDSSNEQDNSNEENTNEQTEATSTSNNISVSSVVGIDEKKALYYSLKSVYDKWIPTYSRNRFKLNSWSEDKDIMKAREKGGDFNIGKVNEYNSFVYKDSFYRNIGGRFLMDAKKLYDTIEAHFRKGASASCIEFLSEMAYSNKLLFMPLPVLTEGYDIESIKKIFTPSNLYNSSDIRNSRQFGTTYVVMYTHEPSKNLNIGEYADDVGMENDGLDIADTNGNILPFFEEFLSENTNNSDYDIPAFGVTFAKQNQTYFKNISINMENSRTTDYAIMNTLLLSSQETNGDLNAPLTKGQNMYSIYSNRVYDCTVEMLGCMNIMPTMFFQLNNIPMFKGAYRIVNVSHHIEPGNITTKFVGTRVSKNCFRLNNSILNIEGFEQRTGSINGLSEIVYGDSITGFRTVGTEAVSGNNIDHTSEIVEATRTGLPEFLNGPRGQLSFSVANFVEGFKKRRRYPGTCPGRAANSECLLEAGGWVDHWGEFTPPLTPYTRVRGNPQLSGTSAYTHYCASAVKFAIADGLGTNANFSLGDGFWTYRNLAKKVGFTVRFNIPSAGKRNSEIVQWIKRNKHMFLVGDVAIMPFPTNPDTAWGHICAVVEKNDDGVPIWCTDCNQGTTIYPYGGTCPARIFIYRFHTIQNPPGNFVD